MNSTTSHDREHLVLETAKCLKNIYVNTKEVNKLHKDLLEYNLSLRAYIEESKSRLNILRSDLANEAKSSHEVVAILTEKCKYNTQIILNMSNQSPTLENETYHGNKKRKIMKRVSNCVEHLPIQDSINKFVTWYKHMIDYERQNLSLYLADSVTLEWFGRTIRTRKKVSAFLSYDMECTRHDFRSSERIEKIQSREERDKSASALTTSINPEILKSTSKRKLRSNSNSPEGTSQILDVEPVTHCKRRRLKLSHTETIPCRDDSLNKITNIPICEDKNDICNKGDGIGYKLKRTSITPTNVECGQGDCNPSTSGTDADRSHDITHTISLQLPKLAVECNGYIEFTRSRNNHCVDAVKWNRKCKVQVSYSEDCLNPGEYIIWTLCYNDGSKCRRNLLAAFEDAAKEDEC